MAKINDVQVIEKNTGEKIQWEQDGYRLSFDDDALSVKVTKYQGEPQEGADESGDTNRQTVERTKNPLDMAEVKLILWSIE